MKNKVINILVSLGLFLSATNVSAGLFTVNPNPPSLKVVNVISDITGSVSGYLDSAGDFNTDMTNPDNKTIVFPISGKLYATNTDGFTGKTLGSYSRVGSVSSTVLFDVSFFSLLGDWSVLPATMPWTMDKSLTLNVSGSTFKVEEPMTGRAFPQLGPVEDPQVTGTMALRIAGCSGVREVSGSGPYAGTVGTLCLNGTFIFDENFNATGGSNCTIAIHKQ